MATDNQKRRKAVTPDEIAFLNACERGDLTTVNELLNRGVNPHVYGEDGSSGLLLAAYKNQPNVLQRLVDKGVDPNAPDENGEKPLEIAASLGHASAVRVLVNAPNIDLNTPDNDGKTPLGLLPNTPAYNGLRDLIRHKIKSKSNQDTNTQDQTQEQTTTQSQAQEQTETQTPQNNQNTVRVAESEDEKNFIKACENGDLAQINRLLERGVNPHVCAEDGSSGILLAAYKNHPNVLQRLVDAGVNPNTPDENGEKPLEIAAARGYEEATRILLKAPNIDLNSRDSDGKTPFDLLPNTPEYDNLRQLMSQHGAQRSLTARDKNLFSSIKRGDIQTFENLIDNNNLNVQDEIGKTPLYRAVETGNTEITNRLLAFNNLDVNSVNESSKDTPLIIAAANGNTEIALNLIKHRHIDLNHKNIDGNTALSYAAANGRTEIVDALIRTNNIDINQVNTNNSTPLNWASSNGHVAVVKRLLKEDNINPNIPNDKGRTAVHEAASQNHPEVLNELVKKEGIDLNKKDKKGNTAIHLAAQSAHPGPVRSLVENNAKLNELNNDKKTPLDLIPNTQENQDLIRYMRDKGARTSEELQNNREKPQPDKEQTQPTQQPTQQVIRHQYGADTEEHSRAVTHAENRINRSGKSRIARRQRAILKGGSRNVETANANALSNIRAMESAGILPTGPNGQSNAEVYLYRMQQARLFYNPKEKLQMSDGSYQTTDSALGSENGDMTYRQVYSAITKSKIDPNTEEGKKQLKNMARSVQVAEGCINNKGQARTTPKIPMREENQSYNPGGDKNIQKVNETLHSSARENITHQPEQDYSDSIAARINQGHSGYA